MLYNAIQICTLQRYTISREPSYDSCKTKLQAARILPSPAAPSSARSAVNISREGFRLP